MVDKYEEYENLLEKRIRIWIEAVNVICDIPFFIIALIIFVTGMVLYFVVLDIFHFVPLETYNTHSQQGND